MATAAIRERLYDFIRVADDKKVKAIYMMLEDEIEETIEWWKDNTFLDELNKRYAAWENGSEKAYSLQDIESSISELKKRRAEK